MRLSSRLLLSWVIGAMCFGAAAAKAQEIGARELNRVAEDLRLKTGASEFILARDKTVVEASYPYLKEAYARKGFADDDSRAAVLSGWRDLRLSRGSSGVIEMSAFRTYVNALGRVTIESEPTEAAIQIDSVSLESTTNTTKWLQAGSYRVVLSKEGFRNEEGELTVLEGRSSLFRRVLRPKLQ